MTSTYDTSDGGTSIREALRALRNAPNSSDGSSLSIVSPSALALELTPADATVPRLEAAATIEEVPTGARLVGDAAVAFAAFLDGIQVSQVMLRGTDGAPVVHGTVAAVIRRRTERVLRVWRGAPRVSRALYAPLALFGARELAWLRRVPMGIVDTLGEGDGALPRHPLELVSLARTAVQRRRESLEIALAEDWCDAESEPLFVDGGISGAGRASQSARAVGVVKSHRTLYATGDSLAVVTRLEPGARTASFEIRSPRRTNVASWYLRLRSARGRDPFFGLVRVEIARDSFSPARADEISRWVLAERTPVSLPDKRWSTMAYGVRDCEEYLRALTGVAS